jgi:hypothetical protein
MWTWWPSRLMTNILVDPRFGHRYIKAMPKTKAYDHLKKSLRRVYTSYFFFFIEGQAAIATESLIGLVEVDAGAYAGSSEELPYSFSLRIYKLR